MVNVRSLRLTASIKRGDCGGTRTALGIGFKGVKGREGSTGNVLR